MKLSKHKICEIAIDLFHERGYDNVTIQDICKKLNITKPTFYSYLASKEEIILDLYDQTIDSLIHDTIKLVEADTHLDQLYIVFSTLMTDTIVNGSDLLSQMLIANLKENRGSFEMRGNLTDLCLVILNKSLKANEIHTSYPINEVYSALAHCFTGFLTMWSIHQGDYDIEEEFYKAMNAILIVDEQYNQLYKKYLTKNS